MTAPIAAGVYYATGHNVARIADQVPVIVGNGERLAHGTGPIGRAMIEGYFRVAGLAEQALQCLRRSPE